MRKMHRRQLISLLFLFTSGKVAANEPNNAVVNPINSAKGSRDKGKYFRLNCLEFFSCETS